MASDDWDRFRNALKSIDEYKEKYFSVDKIKAYLGDEPWNEETVLFLYMKNYEAMNTILQDLKGYKIYSKLSEYMNLLQKENSFYEKIIEATNRCNSEITKRNTNDVDIHRILSEYQETVNLYFFGYACVASSLICIENNLQSKYAIDKDSISKKYDEYLVKVEAHYAIILLRNKLCHGKYIYFKWTSKDKNIKFTLDEKTLLSIDKKNDKDEKGIQYLISISGDIIKLISPYHQLCNIFHKYVYELILNENIKEIQQCNSYYKKIYTQTDIQARNIFKHNKPTPYKIHDSDTFYLNRAMGLVEEETETFLREKLTP